MKQSQPSSGSQSTGLRGLHILGSFRGWLSMDILQRVWIGCMEALQHKIKDNTLYTQHQMICSVFFENIWSKENENLACHHMPSIPIIIFPWSYYNWVLKLDVTLAYNYILCYIDSIFISHVLPLKVPPVALKPRRRDRHPTCYWSPAAAQGDTVGKSG